MERKNRYLIGHGERLTKPIPPPPINPTKAHPYSIDEAIERLTPKIEKVSHEISKIPNKACPNDETITVMTLHPSYIAKSYMPTNLLRSSNFRSVGSKAISILPDKTTKKEKPSSSPSISLFVAGKRHDFLNWLKVIKSARIDDRILDEFRRIEDFRFFSPGERIRKLPGTNIDEQVLLETVLHSSSSGEDNYILRGFYDYLDSIGLKPNVERRLFAGGLCFMPLLTPYGLIPEVEKFSFLRVLRQMPKLRSLFPGIRSVPGARPISCTLPKQAAIDPTTKVAVFDGGTPDDVKIRPWVNIYKAKGVKKPSKEFLKHGLAVSSALLFGPIQNKSELDRPYTKIDHYQVIDEHTDNIYDLYDVLHRIKDILDEKDYEFFNLSIGPALPIEDDEVHAWTSVLDQYLSNGKNFASIAVGNDGDKDYDSGNARIQVPSDCVNGVSVGACDSLNDSIWKRAPYSSMGPGRSPGIVKPDIVAFGGTLSEPYYVLNSEKIDQAIPTCGTSFAAPTALKMALGLKTHFGGYLSPLAIKALLIHRSDNCGHNKCEVGWGKIPHDISSIVVCDDGVATIIYQGKIDPSKYLRAQIPTPSEPLKGLVTINATFCFATDTDPQDPVNYTRSGLEIVFRPHDGKFNPDSQNPKTKTFFSPSKLYSTENELRRDAHKWETVLHESVCMRSTSLSNPYFDIHYNARTSGGLAINPSRISYALAVTLKAKDKKLYDNIINRYRTQLEVLEPILEIPIRATT